MGNRLVSIRGGYYRTFFLKDLYNKGSITLDVLRDSIEYIKNGERFTIGKESIKESYSYALYKSHKDYIANRLSLLSTNDINAMISTNTEFKYMCKADRLLGIEAILSSETTYGEVVPKLITNIYCDAEYTYYFPSETEGDVFVDYSLGCSNIIKVKSSLDNLSKLESLASYIEFNIDTDILDLVGKDSEQFTYKELYDYTITGDINTIIDYETSKITSGGKYRELPYRIINGLVNSESAKGIATNSSLLSKVRRLVDSVDSRTKTVISYSIIEDWAKTKYSSNNSLHKFSEL